MCGKIGGERFVLQSTLLQIHAQIHAQQASTRCTTGIRLENWRAISKWMHWLWWFGSDSSNCFFSKCFSFKGLQKALTQTEPRSSCSFRIGKEGSKVDRMFTFRPTGCEWRHLFWQTNKFILSAPTPKREYKNQKVASSWRSPCTRLKGLDELCEDGDRIMPKKVIIFLAAKLLANERVTWYRSTC